MVAAFMRADSLPPAQRKQSARSGGDYVDIRVISALTPRGLNWDVMARRIN